jgi:hypothetical protein
MTKGSLNITLKIASYLIPNDIVVQTKVIVHRAMGIKASYNSKFIKYENQL